MTDNIISKLKRLIITFGLNTNTIMKLFSHSVPVILTGIVSHLIIADTTLAQLLPDQTLSTTVTHDNKQFQITGGSVVGNNLFHSFTEFSLSHGETALFNNPVHIENIISRVTGNNISYINGIIATNPNGMANLFLLNPNGIIFGSEARLNINGSFIATTADSIRFQDGSEFSATNPSSSPLLTVSTPVGLQFGKNPGKIINRASRFVGERKLGLEINSPQTLALVGGEIILEDGALNVVEGRIEIGAVEGNNFVSLNPISQGWQLGYKNVSDFQNISLSQGSIVDGVGNNATISVQGKHITLQENSQLVIAVLNNESTGDLIVNATESVEMSGANTGIAVFALENTMGEGGHLIINTKKLIAQDGASLSTINFGRGKVGEIIVNAAESVDIIGTGTSFPSVFVSSALDQGEGGKVIVNTKSLRLIDGGIILADTTGQGQGGDIIINTSDNVEIRGTGLTKLDQLEFSSLLSTASGNIELNLPGQGIAGNIHINTRDLIISEGGEIRVGSFQGGTAGNLIINGNSVFLNNGRLLADSTSSSGGNIWLNLSDFLILRNNSLISAEAGTDLTGGDGGNININARFILAVPSENSDISANAFFGTGGNVNITAQGIFGIEFRPQSTPLSDITVSSQFGQSGVVTLNQIALDPQNTLVSLPSEVVDASNLVVQACGVGGVFANSQFVNIGRGGLPTDPYNDLELTRGLADLGEFHSTSSLSSPPRSFPSRLRIINPIVEAQGWIINEEGNIVLTTQVSQVTPNSYGLTPPKCENFFLQEISLAR